MLHTQEEINPLALELGRMFLQYAEGIDMDHLARQVQCDTMSCLRKIQTALDDESMDDFECVDKIVDLLADIGLRTSRHDFG